LEAALDAGAEDVATNDDGSVEVVSSPADFVAVRNSLAKAGLKPDLAEITWKPAAENVLKGDEAGRMQKLLEALENIDDVQEVYTTAVIDQ
jgi:transcriptional/translational regulatory protein YebC/TACO1